MVLHPSPVALLLPSAGSGLVVRKKELGTLPWMEWKLLSVGWNALEGKRGKTKEWEGKTNARETEQTKGKEWERTGKGQERKGNQ